MLKMFLKLLLRNCDRNRKPYIRWYTNRQHFHTYHEEPRMDISSSSLKHFIKQRCSGIVDGYTCIITNCPICSNAKKDSKLHINKRTGFFMCNECESMGSWNTLEKFLSTQDSSELFQQNFCKSRSKENSVETWKRVTKTCHSIKNLPAQEYKTLLNEFSFPHILQEDMSKLNCFYEKTTNLLYFPLLGLNDNIVGYKVLSTNPQKEETVPAFGVSGCIVYKQCQNKNNNTAVVVGMIDDLLALILKKCANVIICLPYSLKSLPQEVLPFMECFKKLILWFGNDEISWYTAKHFAKKLNEKRCYFVRPMNTQPRPKLAAEMNYDFKSILRNAQPSWHKSIITFQELREEVLSNLQNNDKVQGIKWKRYPALNNILKGHRRGELTILTGPTGCGKTTFISEYSLDLAMQGVNTLWGSFEIRNVRLARTMLQQMVGVPLEENLENFNSYADAFEKLPIYFMTFHGQQNIKIVMDAVEHATYVHDIAHVIIDNVQFMMGTGDESMQLSRFWKQDDIIEKFRNFATMCNCHVTLIIHPRKERNDEELTTSSIFGSAKASQEADNVFIIQDNRLTNVRGKKYLQVVKNRYSGDLGVMLLDFNKSNLSYAQKAKVKGKSNEKEKSLSKKHQTNKE